MPRLKILTAYIDQIEQQGLKEMGVSSLDDSSDLSAQLVARFRATLGQALLNWSSEARMEVSNG